MTLLDQISDALGASGALSELSNTLGSSQGETDSLLGAALPALLGGLGAQGDGDVASALFGMLSADKGSFADSIGAFFAQGDKTGLASKLVGSLFGSQRSAVESHVSNASGGAISLVSRALPMLAPAVLGLLGKITADDGLDSEGLTGQLGLMGADGPLGDILGSSTDEDRAGFIAGLADLKEAGGLAALIPAASSTAVATTGAAAGATAAAGAAATQFMGFDDDDRDRNGLGWLLPILAPIGLLIAGLILWQCTSLGDNETEFAEVEVLDEIAEEAQAEPAAEETEAAPAAAPEPTAVPDPEPTTTPEPEPTATPEPAPAAPTIADIAGSRTDLTTLVSLATDLGLAGQISDPDAGPFTVFAPTDASFEAASGVLERLDGGQVATTVTYHVVPGIVTAADLTPGATFETVAGEILTIGADGSLPGGVTVIDADVEASNGVVHVVENVLVPSSIQRFLTTQDVNAIFQLAPIQFASGSADILPESIPTLDEAVVTLSNVPAGSQFEVQGHTDTDGSAELNQALSEARAASVVTYLTNNGVDADLLTPIGFGETQLKVDPENTPEDKAQNRRIEFVDISN